MKILIDDGHGIETPGKRSPDGGSGNTPETGSSPPASWTASSPSASMPNFIATLRCKTVSEQVCHRLADALRSIGLRPRLPHIKGKAVKRLRRKH